VLPPIPRTRGRDAAYFQLVESVPEATIYGEPGAPRTQPVWLQMIRQATQRIDKFSHLPPHVCNVRLASPALPR